MKQYFVYIPTNKIRGSLYVGVTNNLERRGFQHNMKLNPQSFSARYNTYQLVYFEETPSIEDAIRREKQIKNWHRQWKINLIESVNPNWNNLFATIDNEILKQVQDDTT